jgi:hypothetical protein
MVAAQRSSDMRGLDWHVHFRRSEGLVSRTPDAQTRKCGISENGAWLGQGLRPASARSIDESCRANDADP